MTDETEKCAGRVELETRIKDLLRNLAALAAQEADLVSSEDEPRMDAVDQEIETVLGEKERSIGALKQHRSEHGC
jgi:hypothetical protein